LRQPTSSRHSLLAPFAGVDSADAPLRGLRAHQFRALQVLSAMRCARG